MGLLEIMVPAVSRRAWVAISLVLAGCGSTGSTQQASTRYSEPLSGEALAHFEAGRAARDTSDWQGASSAYARAIELAPYSLEAHDAYLRTVQGARSRSFSGSRRADRDSIDKVWSGVLRELADRYASWQGADPENPLFPYIQSLIYWDLNLTERSIAAAHRAAEIDPGLLPIWEHLGSVSEYLADYDAARRYYERALKLEPSNLKVLRGLLPVGQQGGWRVLADYGERLVTELLARGSRGDSIEAGSHLMWLGIHAPGPAEKVEYYRRAVEVSPARPNVYAGLYRVLLEHRPGEAAEALRAAVESGVSAASRTQYSWATRYHRQALLDLGRVLRQGGQAEVAIGYLREALALTEKGRVPTELDHQAHREVELELGLTFAALGDTVQALEQFLTVLTERDDTTAHREYSKIAGAQGASAMEVQKAIWQRRLRGARAAADFALPDVNGDTVRLADFAGAVVLLSFWFPSCGPCRDEFPYLADLARNIAVRGLKVVTINGVPSQNDDVKPILDNYGYPFTSLLTPHRDWALNNFRVSSYPTNFLISPDGKVISKPVIRNREDQAELERWLESYYDYLGLTRSIESAASSR